jgi:hypothetical protein
VTRRVAPCHLVGRLGGEGIAQSVDRVGQRVELTGEAGDLGRRERRRARGALARGLPRARNGDNQMSPASRVQMER